MREPLIAQPPLNYDCSKARMGIAPLYKEKRPNGGRSGERTEAAVKQRVVIGENSSPLIKALRLQGGLHRGFQILSAASILLGPPSRPKDISD